MKKIIALMLALVMVMSMAACGNTAEPTTPPTDAPATETPVETPVETPDSTDAPVVDDETEAPTEEVVTDEVVKEVIDENGVLKAYLAPIDYNEGGCYGTIESIDDTNVTLNLMTNYMFDADAVLQLAEGNTLKMGDTEVVIETITISYSEPENTEGMITVVINADTETAMQLHRKLIVDYTNMTETYGDFIAMDADAFAISVKAETVTAALADISFVDSTEYDPEAGPETLDGAAMAEMYASNPEKFTERNTMIVFWDGAPAMIQLYPIYE